MEINSFIENILDQFDERPNEVITPETNHHQIEGWTSMVALSVMAMIDEEYDVQIKANEMRDSKSIQELFNIVNSYLN